MPDNGSPVHWSQQMTPLELLTLGPHAYTTSLVSSGVPAPERTESSLSETPEPVVSVALIPASGSSRSGPEFDCGEGVFQLTSPGKYSYVFETFPLRDVFSLPRRLDVNEPQATYYDATAYSSWASSPGCTELSTWEAPRPFVSVAQFPASDISHPGPEFVCGEGVLQPVQLGKYPNDTRTSSPCDEILLPDRPRQINPQASTGEVVDANDGDIVNIYYQNVGGINTSVNQYLLATSCCSYEVVALTETWLDERTISSQVLGADYVVYRCDRGPHNSLKSSGGGVLLAVKSSLSAVLLEDESWNNLELLWVCIELGDRKLYLCVVYLPPDRTKDVAFAELFSRSLLKVVDLASPADDIVIVGDFNLPGIRWDHAPSGFLFPSPALSTLSEPTNVILDGLSSAALRQINSVVNENGRMLDLCFVTETDRPPSIELAPTPLVKDVAHHPALLLSLMASRTAFIECDAPSFYVDFKSADYDAIFEILTSIDWESEFLFLNPSAAAEKFTHILNYAIDRHVPKRLSAASHRTPWFTKDLRRLKSIKRKALRNYSRFKSAFFKDQYRKLNTVYKKASLQSYRSYLNRVQRNLKSRPKLFWKHINDQRKESGLPSCMFLHGESASSAPSICDLFAEKFSGTFSSESIDAQQVESAANNVPLLNNTLNSIRIDETAILKAAAKLKGSSSPGPDGIPASFLKRCIRHLLFPIRHIFQSSLDYAVFPDLWKEAFMFPIHKKGDRRNVNNYRGISALCAVSKLFELVVFEPIFAHSKQYFSNDQHGFMPKRSTTTNLLKFTSSVQESFAKNSQTDAIYTDLTAAFDKVNHQIAVAKLSRLGFCGSLLNWFQSYLSGRNLSVRLNDSFSKPFSAPSGVPQGSHLGPLVFLVYFNDALEILEGPKISYADDLKLFKQIDSFDDVKFLQRQLYSFANWCELNALPLNCCKCAVITFTRKRNPILADYYLGGQQIPRVQHMKDLGVILDPKLEFKLHTNYVVDKASRCLGFIFRSAKEFTDVYCLKSLYCSLVRSVLEYASAVWSPYYQNGADRIETVQRRFIRFALRHLNWQDPYRLPSYESRCRLIDIDTLQDRRCVARAVFVADLLESRIDCPYLLEAIRLSVRSTGLRRRNLLLQVSFRRNNYGANSGIIGVVKTFNRFADYFDFQMGRASFKRRIFSVLR